MKRDNQMDECKKISLIGDIMCKKDMCKAAKAGNGYDFSPCFQGVKELFSRSDLVIGNLETPISERNEDLVSRNIRFNAPREFAEAVYESGIHAVSTANNHCLDQGIPGIESTIRVLDEIGFLHTGVFQTPNPRRLTLELGEIRIGMLSYTYGTNAFHNRIFLKETEEWRVNLLQKQELHNPLTRYIYFRRKKLPFYILNKLWYLFHPQYIGKSICERRQSESYELSRLKEDIEGRENDGLDFMLMCLHCGGQYGAKPTKYTMQLEKKLLNAGVNLIIVNHEHVIQGCNLSHISDNQFTAYCLGNFLGTAGVINEPFGKGAEFSCACHVYLGKTGIQRISFSILKTVPIGESGGVGVFPLYDLIRAESSADRKSRLETELFQGIKRFAGKKFFEDAIRSGEIQQEYVLYQSAPPNS
ncbi:MAG: CapA family protein [Lachnospiraceae bacterium]|nr:CapA family protein [Lachnospiraceae bacterium]